MSDPELSEIISYSVVVTWLFSSALIGQRGLGGESSFFGVTSSLASRGRSLTERGDL